MLNLIKVIHKDDLDSSYSIIENCSKTDVNGKNYLVVIEKENILDLAKALGCKDEKSIKDIQKRIQLNQIADMILMALDSDEDTLTAHLINEFGSMDNILVHYGLIERTEDEKRIDEIVSSEDFLKESFKEPEKQEFVREEPIKEETTKTTNFEDFQNEDTSDFMEDYMDDSYINSPTPTDTLDEIESVKNIFNREVEEPINAYALQSNLDIDDDMPEVPNPYEFYKKEEGDSTMRYEDDVYMPPTKINIKTSSNNESGRLVIKGKSRDTENKPQPVHVPQTTSYQYKELKENKEIEEPSNEDLLRVNLMFKKICSRLNLNFEDLEKEVDEEIELLKNPNFSEEELQLAIGRLISSGLLSGVESEFYVKSFESDPGTVTKILRSKLDMLKER